MTAAEVMQDVAMWVAPGASHYGKLGAIAYVEGQWQLHDQPIPQEDARHYLTGFLQEWYADNYEMIDDYIYGLASRISKQAEDGKPMERGLVPMIDMYDDKGFLPALWDAFKRIKIEAAK